jgi:hypothetical protein
MFGLLATQKKYDEIIKPFVALAPVTSVGNMKSPIKFLANGFVMRFIERRGGAFLPSNTVMKMLASWCPESLHTFCSNMIFMLTGFNELQYNKERSMVHFSHFPAGTSAKNMVHFAQGVSSKRFAQYDLGRKKNMDVYGMDKPPEYPIEDITCPYIALMSSENDWLASPKDVDILRSRLNVKPIEDYVVELPQWNHLDFILAKDSGKYVNTKVVDLMDMYD